MKMHVLSLAVAASLASLATMTYAADAIDNQNSVSTPGKPNSGPGVQGFPDTRTGPATRTPGGEEGANEGASSGSSGSDVTQPSQDSSGVEGLPGNKSGPAAMRPGDTDEAGSSKSDSD